MQCVVVVVYVSFGCFCLVGAELSDSTTSETWETSEPSLVNCIEPGGDWRGAHGHVVEVDKVWNSFNGDTVRFIEWLLEDWLLCMGTLGGKVPPWKFAWVVVVAITGNVNHVKFSSFVKGTKQNRFTIC